MMINTPNTEQPAVGPILQSLGNGFPVHVTLPICMDLTSGHFPPQQPRLLTLLPQYKTRGAEYAVLMHDLLAPHSTRKQLYLIRQRRPDEEIYFGELYLIETDRGCMFRVVNPGSEHSVSLRVYGESDPECRLDHRKIRSMWLVCTILDYADSTDEEAKDTPKP